MTLHISKIVKIVESFTNSAMRLPTTWALLDCGHTSGVEMVPTRYRCGECGVEKNDCKQCPCGSRSGFQFAYLPNAHRECDRITKIGDAIQCERCDSFDAKVAKLREMGPGAFQHARFRPTDSRGGREGYYHIYIRDTKSPTGVALFTSLEATPKTEEILRELRLSALSPTESR
jgi:hypothetical protein